MADATDAGRGLALRAPWLYSTPSATRCRWMACWLQVTLSTIWNSVVLGWRWLFRERWQGAYPLYAGAVTVWLMLFMRVTR